MSSSWETHLLITLQFFILTVAYKHTSDVRLNLSVSLEQNVEFICNVSSNITQITWRKDGDLIFSFHKTSEKIFKNLSSERMRIDADDPRKLSISAVQTTDAGIYLCAADTLKGQRKMEWTLNIKGPDSVSQSQRNTKKIIMYSVLPAVGGMCVMVGICGAVLLYKKLNNQDSLNTDGLGAMMYNSGERCTEFVASMTTTEYQFVGKIGREKSCRSDSFQKVNYLEDVKTQAF